MWQLRDEEATIKKWEKFFAISDVDISFEDVIVCLANVGLLQLQLESPTSMGNPHLLRLDNILEDMYRDVGCILQLQILLLEKCDSLAAARRSEMLQLNLEDKVLAGKLRCIVNGVKLTVAGSTEAATKFINSSFLGFLQMIDDLIVRCPWCVEPVKLPPLSSCAFVYECPQVSTNLAYKCVDDLEIQKSISTLITLDDLIATTDSGSNSNSNLSHNETEEMQVVPRPPPELWTTDLIIEDIFKCLTAQECLRLRSVNQQFNHCAVQTLQRRHSGQLKIHFEYDTQTKKFFCPKLIRGIYNKLKLTDLTNIMTLNPRFPCENFAFVKGTIASPDIQGFLEAHGKRVKILHLNLYCEPEYVHTRGNARPPVTQLLALLTRQAPHLQTLRLEGFADEWIRCPWFEPSSDEYFPPSENVKLQNLNSIQFTTKPPKNLVKEFLNVAVNLKTFASVYDLSPFIEMNKFHLLQDLIWEIRTQDNNAEHFNDLNAQLKLNSVSNLRTLCIFISKYYATLDVPPSLMSLITKILEWSAQSLQIFHVMGFMGIFQSLRFPVLSKVKELRLTSRPQYEFCHQFVHNPIPFFPPGFSPAQIFPGLQKITIGFINMNKIILNWNASFGNCFENNPLITVKNLEIEEFRDLPPGWLENLAVVCPCVEFIDVKTILYNFPEDAVKGLWNFKKLKSLKLKINVWAAENAFPAIDRVFTGFSHETCLELFNGTGQTGLESIGGLRAHASLLDLKELTRLQLTFVDVTLPTKIRENPIVSQVSGRYAFAMCPQLKVCVEAEGRTPELSLKLMQDLEPVYPFVHLHTPNNLPSEHFKIIPHKTEKRGNFYNDVKVLFSFPAV